MQRRGFMAAVFAAPVAALAGWRGQTARPHGMSFYRKEQWPDARQWTTAGRFDYGKWKAHVDAVHRANGGCVRASGGQFHRIIDEPFHRSRWGRT